MDSIVWNPNITLLQNTSWLSFDKKRLNMFIIVFVSDYIPLQPHNSSASLHFIWQIDLFGRVFLWNYLKNGFCVSNLNRCYKVWENEYVFGKNILNCNRIAYNVFQRVEYEHLLSKEEKFQEFSSQTLFEHDSNRKSIWSRYSAYSFPFIPNWFDGKWVGSKYTHNLTLGWFDCLKFSFDWLDNLVLYLAYCEYERSKRNES